MRRKFDLMKVLNLAGFLPGVLGVASLSGNVCWAQDAAVMSANADKPAEKQMDRVTLQALKNMRDPFKRLGADNLDTVQQKLKTELETVPVSEFKMVGVLTGPNRTRALVRAPSGSVFPVSDGTRIGVQNGYVRKVLHDRIIVNEIIQDIIGEKELVTSEIRLNSKGVEKGVSSVKAIALSESGADADSSYGDAATRLSGNKQESRNVPVATPAPADNPAPKASAIPTSTATTYGGSNFNMSVPPPLAAPGTMSGGGQVSNSTQQTAGSK